MFGTRAVVGTNGAELQSLLDCAGRRGLLSRNVLRSRMGAESGEGCDPHYAGMRQASMRTVAQGCVSARGRTWSCRVCGGDCDLGNCMETSLPY